MEIFQVFVTMFSKLSGADLLYVGKGYNIAKKKNIKPKSLEKIAGQFSFKYFLILSHAILNSL